MPKVVTFSDECIFYHEDPELGVDYRLSRINPYQQFQVDCELRYTPLLTRILQRKHRAKMKKYIESELERCKKR